MLVLLNTIRRHVPAAAGSGRLLVVELGDAVEARVIHEVFLPETPYRSRDMNPRGGTRGVRACSPRPGGGFAAATYAEIHLLDEQFRLMETLTHPAAAAIHDLVAEKSGMWVASTNADAVLHLDWTGRLTRHWRPTDDPSLRESLGLPPQPPWGAIGDFRDPPAMARQVHDLVHLNAVSRRGDTAFVSLGQVLVPSHRQRQPVSLGAYRAETWIAPDGSWSTSHVIVQIDLPEQGPLGNARILWNAPVGEAPNHNVEVIGDRIWFNDSNINQLVGVDLSSGKELVRIPLPGEFPRGMAVLDPDHVLVGSQHPLAIHLVNLSLSRADRTWTLAGLDNESITSIHCLDDFSM